MKPSNRIQLRQPSSLLALDRLLTLALSTGEFMCHRPIDSLNLAQKVCGFGRWWLTWALLGLSLLLAPSPSYAQAGGSPRERLSLNADWRFQRGDPVEAAGQLNYERIKDQVTVIGNNLKRGAQAPAVLRDRTKGNLGGNISYVQ